MLSVSKSTASIYHCLRFHHCFIELHTDKALSSLSAFLDANLSKLEYNVLMKAELLVPTTARANVFRHLVRLMSIVRTFFCTLQEQHVHAHGNDPQKPVAAHVSGKHSLNEIVATFVLEF